MRFKSWQRFFCFYLLLFITIVGLLFFRVFFCLVFFSPVASVSTFLLYPCKNSIVISFLNCCLLICYWFNVWLCVGVCFILCVFGWIRKNTRHVTLLFILSFNVAVCFVLICHLRFVYYISLLWCLLVINMKNQKTVLVELELYGSFDGKHNNEVIFLFWYSSERKFWTLLSRYKVQFVKWLVIALVQDL